MPEVRAFYSLPLSPDFMKPRLGSAFSGFVILWLATSLPAYAAYGGFSTNVNPDHVANNDLLAWSLLGVLGLTLGMVAACGLGIYRQFRRSRPEAELLEEIKRQARQPGPVHLPPVTPPAPRQSWERPADWWKEETQD